jgi:hypothetical protein
MTFTARNGSITEANMAVVEAGSSSTQAGKDLDTSDMIHKQIHTIEDWQTVLPGPLGEAKNGISKWLNELFGNSRLKG